jgi:hypothetical protein
MSNLVGTVFDLDDLQGKLLEDGLGWTFMADNLIALTGGAC